MLSPAKLFLATGAFLIAAAAIHPQAPATGSLAGRVLDARTERPLPSAEISLAGTERKVRSDSSGIFRIVGVPAGTHTLSVVAIGFAPVVRTDVSVAPGRTTEVTLSLVKIHVAMEAVRVTASAFQRPPDVAATQYTLAYEEVRRSPGALGDVSRLIQALPGVVAPNDQRNDIIARGGSPIENLTLVDNVEVPNLNHFAAQNSTGGPISMLNNEFVEEATFLAGAAPAHFAGRLSSVLDIRLREGPRDRRQAELDVSFAGAGANAEGHLGRSASYLASARVSYLSLLAGPFGLTAIPYTTNAQAKVTWDPSGLDKLWLVAIAGEDHIEFGASEKDRADSTTNRVRSAGDRLVVGANWRRLVGAYAVGTLGVSSAVGRYRVDAFDKTLGNQRVFWNRSVENDVVVKYDLALDFGSLGSAKVGAGWRWSFDRFRVNAPFGSPSPYVAAAQRVDSVALDKAALAGVSSAHAQFNRRIGPRVDITFGARAEHYEWSGKTIVGPRAGANVRVAPTVEVSAAYGRASQQAPLVYLASVPSNRTLDPLRADIAVAGVSYQPRPDLRLSLEFYDKEYTSYPVSVDYPQVSLANTGDVFGVDGLLFALSSAGSGRSRGAEFYVQQKFTGRRYGQLSLTTSQARHRAVDGVLRRGAFDTPVAATVIFGQQVGGGIELSTRGSYASGRPLTPVLQGASFAQNRLIYDVAQLNAERAPPYFRLDLRFDRKRSWRGLWITSFMELDNVTNRRNVFFYQWDPAARALDAVEQLKFFPVGGINIKF